MHPEDTFEVFLSESSDRGTALRSLLHKIDVADVLGKSVLLKANFNSADPFPASTHPDTLAAMVTVLQQAGAREITLAERSGMGDTRGTLEQLGILDLAKRLGFRVVVLDEAPRKDWVPIEHAGTHWLKGFYLPKVLIEADLVVQTCCLKTHRFGGHFTMSLKNSVGLVARTVPGDPHDYMGELHGSPHQRLMIAEINESYPVHLVVMDATKAFVSGGPDKGAEVAPGLMLASADRVAIDAVGVAILRDFGAASLAEEPVFQQEQIRRAAELRVGATSASAIRLTPLDDESAAAAGQIQSILMKE
jgi:uncharacterized protein (DUF362 family)